MDPRIEIWNVLHDGDITVIADESEDTLSLFVSIPYLRRRLKPIGDSFILTLSGLALHEFRNFNGTTTPLREEIDIGSPEIIGTKSETMPVKIETSMGLLTLDFQRLRIALDTGKEISYAILLKTCEEYWAEWEAKAKGRTRL